MQPTQTISSTPLPRCKPGTRGVRKWMTLLSLLSVLQSAGAAEKSASNWAQFRGPNASGISAADTSAPVEFGPETNLLWKVKLPAGHSSPCIFGDKIFLTASHPDKKQLETICVHRVSGKILWRKSLAVEKFEPVHKASNSAASTPACDGKGVYVYHGSFGLVAYDLEGTELWKKPLPMPMLTSGGANGSGTSPIVVEEMILLDMHLRQDSYLLAVRCKDGETVWKTPEPEFNFGFATPIVWKEGSDSLVGVLNGGRFTAYNLKDGSERWWVNGLPVQTIATPVISKDMIFINGTGFLGASENMIMPPSFEEVLTKYDTNKDSLISVSELPGSLVFADRQTTTGVGTMSVQMFLRFFQGKTATTTMNSDEWEKARQELKQFISSTGMKTAVCAVPLGGKGEKQTTWSDSKGVPEVPSPLYYKERLYLVKSGGVVTCREPATGKLLFEERLDAPGGYFASPIASGGRIYAACDSGKVTVFEAKDTLKVLARNDLGEPIWATPAIVDGRIYVRTIGHLYAFGETPPVK